MVIIIRHVAVQQCAAIAKWWCCSSASVNEIADQQLFDSCRTTSGQKWSCCCSAAVDNHYCCPAILGHVHVTSGQIWRFGNSSKVETAVQQVFDSCRITSGQKSSCCCSAAVDYHNCCPAILGQFHATAGQQWHQSGLLISNELSEVVVMLLFSSSCLLLVAVQQFFAMSIPLLFRNGDVAFQKQFKVEITRQQSPLQWTARTGLLCPARPGSQPQTQPHQLHVRCQ